MVSLDTWYPTFPVRKMIMCGRAPECTSLIKIAIDLGNNCVRRRRDCKCRIMAEKDIGDSKIERGALDEGS